MWHCHDLTVLLVTGGEGAYNGLNRRDIFGDLRAYDPKSNTWRNLEVMGGPPYNLLPPARRGHTATVVKTVTRQQCVPPLHRCRPGQRFAIVLTIRRHVAARLVIFGGRGLDRVFGQDVFFNDLQVMDVPSMMWLEMATDGPVPLPRSGHTATYMASNETIVVIGGTCQVSCGTGVPCWLVALVSCGTVSHHDTACCCPTQDCHRASSPRASAHVATTSNQCRSL